jgi:hypothetical protein
MTATVLNEAAARQARKVISQLTGLEVESVAWIRRHEDLEFAALVFYNDDQYERALEFLTDPRHSFHVVRETATRIFIAAGRHV